MLAARMDVAAAHGRCPACLGLPEQSPISRSRKRPGGARRMLVRHGVDRFRKADFRRLAR